MPYRNDDDHPTTMFQRICLLVVVEKRNKYHGSPKSILIHFDAIQNDDDRTTTMFQRIGSVLEKRNKYHGLRYMSSMVLIIWEVSEYKEIFITYAKLLHAKINHQLRISGPKSKKLTVNLYD